MIMLLDLIPPYPPPPACTATEAALLATTGTGIYRAHGEQAWISIAEEKLGAFLLLERLDDLIPAILKVRSLLNVLCDLKEEDDPLVKELQLVHKTIQDEYPNKTLDTLSELVAPVKEVFQEIEEEHLDFFAKLHENELLGFNTWCVEKLRQE